MYSLKLFNNNKPSDYLKSLKNKRKKKHEQTNINDIHLAKKRN